jgi:hypothetical protein
MTTPASDIPLAQRTLCIDFDGVLHTYSRGWHDGTLYDPPIPGAIAALWALREAGYVLVVHTTRCADPSQTQLIRDWLERYGAPVIWKVTHEKLPALAYIDDRAVRFTDWPDIRKRFV